MVKKIDFDKKIGKNFKSDEQRKKDTEEKIESGNVREALEELKTVFKFVEPLSEKAVEPYIQLANRMKEIFPQNINATSIIKKQVENIRLAFNEIDLTKIWRKEDCDTLFKKMDGTGWVLGQQMDYYKMLNLANEDSEYIIQTIIDDYSANDFLLTLDELSDIADFLDNEDGDGFSNQVKQIIEILDINIGFYKTIMPTLITIFQYVYVKVYAGNDENAVMHRHDIVKDLNKRKLNVELGSKYIFYLNELLIFKSSLELFGSFKGSINETNYSRHSIVHGKFNPDRYTEEEFIRLVLLISSICLGK
ncbi:hypothetical protein GNF18_10445 [Ligilactobacillus pobuzihii]|uniref:hypothetical protein n=1 Tax=Ligilactobacillus pobuzihii TaxID=449659 RepID=UPI0019D25ADA|nr:hypothetical protein [Ligilactobacillus pobuzihii]MBN7275560.1 hypothetical protein [Ligilactobacillus pobuzihii]